MERTFAAVLQSALDAKSWTAYQLSEATGVPRSGLSNYLSGKSVPEDKTLAKLAQALGADYERLKAFADIHRLGADGIKRIKKFAPEVLEGGLDPEPPRPKRKTASDTIAQVVAQLPADMKHPPTQKELEILERIGGFDLSEIDPRSQSYIWTMPPGKRLRSLRQAERDWTEANDDAGVAGGED
jgi:transcriptional regulator with XRE-family HTH domain